MSKFTPGPWHSAMKSEKSWNVGVYTEGGDEVAHVAVKSALAAPRRDADSRLIAAAPDLLAMLVEAHDIIDAIGQPETAEVAGRLRAVIAKAKGEA